MKKFISSILTLINLLNFSIFNIKADENNKLFLAFVIDESGSMANSRNDTIGSFNSLINEHKRIEDDVDVSVITNFFNTSNHFVHMATSIQDVEDITEQDYCPKGGTALLDAVGDTISYLDELVEDDPDHSSVMLIIITDGEENSSKEYNRNTIKKMLKERQDNGWTLEFYGAGMDAYNDAKKLGFTSENSICFASTSQNPHVINCMAGVACNKSMSFRGQISNSKNIENKETKTVEVKNNNNKSLFKYLRFKIKKLKNQILKLFEKTQKVEK